MIGPHPPPATHSFRQPRSPPGQCSSIWWVLIFVFSTRLILRHKTESFVLHGTGSCAFLLVGQLVGWEEPSRDVLALLVLVGYSGRSIERLYLAGDDKKCLICSHRRRMRGKLLASSHAATMMATRSRRIPSWKIGVATNLFAMFAPASGLWLVCGGIMRSFARRGGLGQKVGDRLS